MVQAVRRADMMALSLLKASAQILWDRWILSFSTFFLWSNQNGWENTWSIAFYLTVDAGLKIQIYVITEGW